MPAERGTYHHGDLRRAIIDAALEAIREEGSPDFSLRALARRVGVAPSAPYRHFEDKTALLAAIAAEGFRLLADGLRKAGGRADPGSLDHLRELGVAYVRFAARHRAHFRIMFRPELADKTPYPELLAAASDSFSVLTAGIRAAQSSGVVRSEETGRLVRASWGMVHGIAALAVAGQFGQSAKKIEAIARSASDALIRGLEA